MVMQGKWLKYRLFNPITSEDAVKSGKTFRETRCVVEATTRCLREPRLSEKSNSDCSSRSTNKSSLTREQQGQTNGFKLNMRTNYVTVSDQLPRLRHNSPKQN